MSEPIKWGLVLGVAVAIQSLIFGAAGWHKTFSMSFVYLAIAIGINVLSVVACLRQTAAGSTWAGQLKNGLVVGMVGSLIIFTSAWLVTTVVFPNYFGEMAEGYREAYERMDMTREAVEEAVAGTAATSPARSAVEGVIGTLVTSLVVAAISGIWLRRKD